MENIKYLVLLRGINVGGNNIIKMEELKKVFEELKFTDVKTYIQSGNVLFHDHETNKIILRERIEKTLFKKLQNQVNIVILTLSEIKEIINRKPKDFGEDNEYKYDVIYLIEPLKAKDAIRK